MNTMLTVNPAPTTELLSIGGMGPTGNSHLPLPVCAPHTNMPGWGPSQDTEANWLDPGAQSCECVKQPTGDHTETWKRRKDLQKALITTQKLNFNSLLFFTFAVCKWSLEPFQWAGLALTPCCSCHPLARRSEVSRSQMQETEMPGGWDQADFAQSPTVFI